MEQTLTPYQKYMQMRQQSSVPPSNSSNIQQNKGQPQQSAAQFSFGNQNSRVDKSPISTKSFDVDDDSSILMDNNIRNMNNANSNLFIQQNRPAKQNMNASRERNTNFFKNRQVAENQNQMDNTLDQLRAKPIDRSGALTSKRQSDITAKYNTTSLDRSQLFRTKKPANLNNTYNFHNRKKFYGKAQDAQEPQERLLNIELVAVDRLAVTFQGFFSNDIKDAIKTKVSQSNYDAQHKMWVIPKTSYDQLIEEVGPLCIDNEVKIFDVPEFIYNFVKTPIMNSKKFSYKIEENDYKKDRSISTLPEGLSKNLYEFQKQGIEFGVKRFGRILLGDEMGVGKTLQAIGIMYMYRMDWPLIILCPSSLKYSWRDEILKWVSSIKKTDIQLFKTGKDKFDDTAQIFIMSYDLATRRSEEIMGRQFKSAIADEAHYLKSRDAKRCKQLIPILTQAKRCILISGTPMLARPVEIFNLLSILRPDIFSTFKEFSNRYCCPKQGRFGMDYTGNSCTNELHFVLSQNIMIRRLKKDVLHELPDKRRQKIEIQIENKYIKDIQKALDGMRDDPIDGFLKEQVNKQYEPGFSFDDAIDEMAQENENSGSFMIAYKLTGEAKIEGAREFIDTLLEAGAKFLLFGHHQTVLDAYEQHMVKKKVGYIRIDGKVNPEKRHKRVTEFQHEEKIRVAILSINACSQGLTLTAASTVVFSELTWTPSIMAQAEDRAHRISQQNCVNVYYLYGPNTLDDLMFGMINEKSMVVNDALDGQKCDYKISRQSKDEVIEEVKDRQQKGKLNPVIVNRKKSSIEDFQKNKQTFVKKEIINTLDKFFKPKPATLPKQRAETNLEEEIECSSIEPQSKQKQIILQGKNGVEKEEINLDSSGEFDQEEKDEQVVVEAAPVVTKLKNQQQNRKRKLRQDIDDDEEEYSELLKE